MSNELTKETEVSQSVAMIQVIERAALNPEVDVDKMERLWLMKEKIDAKQFEIAFNVAMSKAQADMGRISADKQNNQTRSEYASYSAIDRALRPIYTANGFAISFDTGESPLPLHVRILCHVSHISGHSREYHVDMPADGKGAKGGDVMTKTHATGSAMSYGMRYLLKMIFNVAIGEDDDDGNKAGEIQRITTDQAMQIHAQITDNDLDMGKFMGWLRKAMKCDSIESIPAQALNTVVSTIEATIKNKVAK